MCWPEESHGAPLVGKVAIVTGGGMQPGEINIGHAICLGLIHAGATVAVVDLDPEAAATSSDALISAGGKSIPITADVSHEEDCAAAVQATVNELGRLDVLVNNCGIVGSTARIGSLTEAALDAVMAVNLKGALFMTKHALPRLADGGAIVNLSTISATRPGGGSAYPVSKGAVETLTRVAAIEAAGRQIRVNAVAPGMAWTPQVWRLLAEDKRAEVREGFRRSSLLGVEGTARDIATAVVFLAWAPWISGQVLTVDGGGSLLRPTPAVVEEQ